MVPSYFSLFLYLKPFALGCYRFHYLIPLIPSILDYVSLFLFTIPLLMCVCEYVH